MATLLHFAAVVVTSAFAFTFAFVFAFSRRRSYRAPTFLLDLLSTLAPASLSSFVLGNRAFFSRPLALVAPAVSILWSSCPRPRSFPPPTFLVPRGPRLRPIRDLMFLCLPSVPSLPEHNTVSQHSTSSKSRTNKENEHNKNERARRNKEPPSRLQLALSRPLILRLLSYAHFTSSPFLLSFRFIWLPRGRIPASMRRSPVPLLFPRSLFFVLPLVCKTDKPRARLV